jgi:AcrR family transcriptional regulator
VERALEGRREAYTQEVRLLVQASFALIRDTGRLEPRVSEIVRAAGLSNQAFYKHFRSKDELLLTVLDEGVRLLAGYLRHRMEKHASPELRVRAWVEGMAAQALDPRAAAATRPFVVSRARLGELFPQEVLQSERQLVEILREAIASGVEVGELPSADPERDAETLYTLAMGWVQRKLAQPSLPNVEDARELVDFALGGLRRSRGRDAA